MMTKPFFCVSYFDGDISWIKETCGENYIVYAKSELPENAPDNVLYIPNVGYNIYSYLTYIIDHYDSIPEIVVFCKNNVFDRHVSQASFKSLCTRRVFTPIEEPSRWKRISFPTSLISSEGGYLELNNNWYVTGYDRLYFADFNVFFNYIFKDARRPDYLRFAPGANYVVPRENILLRSRNFYINLRSFVSHSQFSCESHFVERSLIAIWSSALEEGELMRKILTNDEISYLQKQCLFGIAHEKSNINKIKRGLANRLISTIKFISD